MNKKKKILVVEDDGIISENLRIFLICECFDVVCVFNSQEALAACEINSIDLILMDGELPGMSGFETAEMIHFDHPSLIIICISGEDIPAKYKNHFVAHHKKPFMMDPLLNSIKEQIKLAEQVKLLLKP